MTHSLTLGSLLLTDSMPDAEHDFVFDVLAEGLGFGVAQGVQEVVTSLLADGDLVRTRRYGNREVTFAVEITGPSLASLAQGEAALRREVGKSNTLTWQAPDIFAAPTVFEVIDSEMSQTFDDLDELRVRRTFNVTLTCHPFARSAELVTVSAMTSGATTVPVDTCDSVTGWTGTRGGAASPADGPSTIWEAGAVGIMELSNTVGFPPETWTLTRTGAVDFSSTPLLDVEITTLSAKAGAPLSVSAYLDGSSSALPILQTRRLADGSGYFRVTFDTRGATASSITFKHTSAAGYGHAWQGLLVRNVARTDVSPSVTARQQTRVIDPGGTERTPASLHVYSGDEFAGLGVAIVHTCPEDGSGYSPPLRRWRTAGNTPTPSSDTLSGAFEALHPNGFVAEVPASAVPKGGYALVARVISDAAGTVQMYWSVGSKFPGDPTTYGQVQGTTPVHFFTEGVYHLVTLAVVTLPPVRGDQGAVGVVIEHDTGGAAIAMDEAWLFRIDDDCALSIVAEPPAHVWLDSPGIESAQPSVWWGTESNRTNQRHPGNALKAAGNHILHPGGTAVFTAAMVDHPETSATAYPRWHSNAAE